MDTPHTAPGLVAVVVYNGLSLFEYGCAVEVFGLPRPELGDRWYRVLDDGRNTLPLARGHAAFLSADESDVFATGTAQVYGTSSGIR